MTQPALTPAQLHELAADMRANTLPPSPYMLVGDHALSTVTFQFTHALDRLADRMTAAASTVSDTAAPTDREPHLGPDCRDEKHAACRGDAWDPVADDHTDCECPCHTTPKETRP